MVGSYTCHILIAGLLVCYSSHQRFPLINYSGKDELVKSAYEAFSKNSGIFQVFTNSNSTFTSVFILDSTSISKNFSYTLAPILAPRFVLGSIKNLFKLFIKAYLKVILRATPKIWLQPNLFYYLVFPQKYQLSINLVLVIYPKSWIKY